MDWNNIAKSDSDEHGLHFFATACDTLPTTTKNQLGQDLFGKSISSSWARDEHHHTDLVMKAEYFIHARQILDTLCESYHVDSNSDKRIVERAHHAVSSLEIDTQTNAAHCSLALTHHWHSLRETPSFVNVTQTQTQADLTTFASWFRRVTLTQHLKNVNNISLSLAMITLFKHQTQTLACWHISPHCLWLITATLRTTLLSPFAVH